MQAPQTFHFTAPSANDFLLLPMAKRVVDAAATTQAHYWLSTGRVCQINAHLSAGATIEVHDYVETDGRPIKGGHKSLRHVLANNGTSVMYRGDTDGHIQASVAAPFGPTTLRTVLGPEAARDAKVDVPCRGGIVIAVVGAAIGDTVQVDYRMEKSGGTIFTQQFRSRQRSIDLVLTSTSEVDNGGVALQLGFAQDVPGLIEGRGYNVMVSDQGQNWIPGGKYRAFLLTSQRIEIRNVTVNGAGAGNVEVTWPANSAEGANAVVAQ